MLTIDEIYKAIEANYQPRRKWDRGVKEAALDILESLDMPNAVLPVERCTIFGGSFNHYI